MSRIATRLTHPVGVLLRGVQDAVLPQTCITCGVWVPAGSEPACGPCRERLAAIMRVSYCPHCGRTMPRAAIGQRNCARCRHESFWNVAGVVRVGAYKPSVRRLITGLKYGGHERNAEMAGDLLAKAIHARLGGRAGLPGAGADALVATLAAALRPRLATRGGHLPSSGDSGVGGGPSHEAHAQSDARNVAQAAF